jgi:hypothetical protein
MESDVMGWISTDDKLPNDGEKSYQGAARLVKVELLKSVYKASRYISRLLTKMGIIINHMRGTLHVLL